MSQRCRSGSGRKEPHPRLFLQYLFLYYIILFPKSNPFHDYRSAKFYKLHEMPDGCNGIPRIPHRIYVAEQENMTSFSGFLSLCFLNFQNVSMQGMVCFPHRSSIHFLTHFYATFMPQTAFRQLIVYENLINLTLKNLPQPVSIPSCPASRTSHLYPKTFIKRFVPADSL